MVCLTASTIRRMSPTNIIQAGMAQVSNLYSVLTYLTEQHTLSRVQLLEWCRDNSVVWENPVRENTTHYTVEYTCKTVLVVSYHALGCERTYYSRIYSGSNNCPNVCMFFTKVDNP